MSAKLVRGEPLREGALQHELHRRGVTQTDLARETGLALSTINRACGGYSVNTSSLRRISQVLSKHPPLELAAALLVGGGQTAG